MDTPAARFVPAIGVSTPAAQRAIAGQDRSGGDWVSRRVCANGIVSVSWQQVCVGRHHAGARCDVHVDGDLLRFWIGDDLVKTAAKTSPGAVRKRRAARTSGQV